ncbi:MAG: UDP-glucose:(heptosyl)LPS alpha,3-glucosyltransferase [Verrucomicrobiota bacterium]
MPNEKLNICFVRRGYSRSGGAEAYLKRLAQGMANLGHDVRLFTTYDWPEKDQPFSKIFRIDAKSPAAFANELERMRPNLGCNMLVSLERVCQCDVYRAGDGVHLAWLNRRRKFEMPWEGVARKFNPKHNDLLRLEKSLLDDRGAERVITNSQMVKDEIIDLYNYRRDKIDVVPNGIPLEQYRFDPAVREKSRAELELAPDDVAVLFAGTGWRRKGLRYAVAAVEACEDSKIRLLVAGRGDQTRYQSERARFLGEIADLRPIYAAADIFILPTIYDPFSNACLEALACGLPVITTRTNGFSEIMEDRIHGSIVDTASDIADLQKAVELWRDSTRRSVARQSILKRASQFDISRNVEKTLQILGQLAANAAST